MSPVNRRSFLRTIPGAMILTAAAQGRNSIIQSPNRTVQFIKLWS